MIVLLYKSAEIFEKKHCCVTQVWYAYMQYHFNLYTVFPVSEVLNWHGPELVNDADRSKKKKHYRGKQLVAGFLKFNWF